MCGLKIKESDNHPKTLNFNNDDDFEIRDIINTPLMKFKILIFVLSICLYLRPKNKNACF